MAQGAVVRVQSGVQAAAEAEARAQSDEVSAEVVRNPMELGLQLLELGYRTVSKLEDSDLFRYVCFQRDFKI